MLLFVYIVKELVFPFLLATGVISAIMLMDQIFQFIPFLQASGLELKSVGQMILYSISPILLIACPVSVLIGVYVGITRITSDYELVVMRASGVSLSYIFKPVLAVALVIAMFVMSLAFYFSPHGMSRLEELKFSILKKHTKIQLSVNRINDFFGEKLIYIFEKEGDLMRGIVITDKDLPQHYSVIEADHGRIFFDDQSQKILFRLEDGKIHNDRGEDGYQIITYDRLDYDLAPPQRDRSNLPSRFKNGGDSRNYKTDSEFTVMELLRKLQTVPEDSQLHYDYVDEFHARIVTVLSCLCLAFFAVPMGIYDPRSPKAGNILYMLVVIIIYFLVFARARSLLLQGDVPPAALYLPLLFVMGLGAYNYLKTNYNFNSIAEIIRFRMGSYRSKQ